MWLCHRVRPSRAAPPDDLLRATGPTSVRWSGTASPPRRVSARSIQSPLASTPARSVCVFRPLGIGGRDRAACARALRRRALLMQGFGDPSPHQSETIGDQVTV
jgi:hypothetical protein